MLTKLTLDQPLLNGHYRNFLNGKLEANRIFWKALVDSVRANSSLWQAIHDDPTLGRLQQYLGYFEFGEPTPRSFDFFQTCPQGTPIYPIQNTAVHRPENYDWVTRLEESFDLILNEAAVLTSERYLHYDFDGTGVDMSVFPLFHEGQPVEKNMALCPNTTRLVKSIPRFCGDFFFANTLFSLMPAGTHLLPHCSSDNLRLRCMVGIDVPDNCFIRVTDWHYHWKVGKAFLWEDSFEHESANQDDRHRIVLVFDMWHPELSDKEIHYLSQIFSPQRLREAISAASS